MDYERSRAYTLGYDAYSLDIMYSQNPFDLDSETESFDDWCDGWHDSQCVANNGIYFMNGLGE